MVSSSMPIIIIIVLFRETLVRLWCNFWEAVHSQNAASTIATVLIRNAAEGNRFSHDYVGILRKVSQRMKQ